MSIPRFKCVHCGDCTFTQIFLFTPTGEFIVDGKHVTMIQCCSCFAQYGRPVGETRWKEITREDCRDSL